MATLNMGYFPNISADLSNVLGVLFSNEPSSSKLFVFPGFTDVHVHFREPGFSYKETVKTGSMAAARGGYTTVFTMPNLNPVPDSPVNLKSQLDIIEKDASIRVLPYGSITVCEQGKELSYMAGMKDYVVAFSDDGRGVQNAEMMEEAMKLAKAMDKIIVAHCEVNDLLEGGYIHKGNYAAAHGHRGISSESEWKQVERDINLAAKTGCKYHVCHISTKESVDLVRQAKKTGIDVTCETGPHYLVFDDSDIKEAGNWKMNPPLRGRDDKKALLEGVIDGTIDMIATDHAPHSKEEKAKGLEKSAFGIVGLETAFPVIYTELVRKNIITLDKAIELLSDNPSKRFGISPNGLSVWNLEEKYIINPDEFLSMGRSTPFEGMEVFGRCYATICGGKEVFRYEKN